MDTISELFKGFDRYEYDIKKAIDYLFSKALSCEATIHGLREFTLTKLSDSLDVPYEHLQKEFDEFCEPYYKNAIADFLTHFGSIDDSQKPK